MNNIYIILNDLFKFYNKNIKKKHITISIIMILIFFIAYSMGIEQKEYFEVNNVVKPRLTLTFESFMTSSLIVFSGLIPYIFIPVIAVIFVPSMYAISIVNSSGIAIVLLIIAQLLKICIYSLIVSIGVFWCALATKKYRYDSYVSFSFDELRKDVYSKLKKDNKVKEIENKINKRNEKIRKLNVKIPYKNIILLSTISILVLTLVTLIVGV